MSNVRQADRGDSVDSAFAIEKPVLIVGRDRTLSLFLKTMVEDKLHCCADLASNLHEVKSLLDEDAKYLVAVCDLESLNAEFEDTLNHIHSGKIPVIALSGDLNAESRDVYQHKGVVDYVLKGSTNAFNYIVELIGRYARNKNIGALLVSDSPTGQREAVEFLQAAGLQVSVSEHVQDAMQQALQQPNTKLMLIDCETSPQDTIELISEIRKFMGKERLAIIGVSGSSGSSELSRFLKVGANDVLRKPLNREEFFCRVNQNLEVLELIERNYAAANFDYLTKIYNRRCFFELGQALVRQAFNVGHPAVAGILDIDYFKQVNDIYGHEAGDVVLEWVAGLIKESFTDQLAARLGGEEFAVLFTEVPLNEARQRFEDFRHNLASKKIVVAGQTISVTISIGISSAGTDDLGSLLCLADDKLYEAKHLGRNRIVL